MLRIKKNRKRDRRGGEFSINNKSCHSSFFYLFPSPPPPPSSLPSLLPPSHLLVTSLFHVIDRVSFLSTLFINDTAAAFRFSASFSRQFNPIQLNDHFGTDSYSHVLANLLDKVHHRNDVFNHF